MELASRRPVVAEVVAATVAVVEDVASVAVVAAVASLPSSYSQEVTPVVASSVAVAVVVSVT